tara:strand:- start:602 stop:853 length:252 start_codon:yes stop_codon:yes gene_type:complete
VIQTRQRPYRRDSKKKTYDPTPEYFKMTPSQHPDDKELVQRREVLEAIIKVSNFLEDADYVNSKMLVNALDEIYHYIEEGDYG